MEYILNLAACSELRFGQILTAAAAKFYQNPIFKSSFAVVIRLENYVPCGDDDVMGCSKNFSEMNFLCVFNFGDLNLKFQI